MGQGPVANGDNGDNVAAVCQYTSHILSPVRSSVVAGNCVSIYTLLLSYTRIQVPRSKSQRL
jgi:hypothetical protein